MIFYGKLVAFNLQKLARQMGKVVLAASPRMHIEEGAPADYKALSHFHYRSSRLPPSRKIFKLKRKDELYGVIVYSYPPPTIFRRKALKGSLSQL